MPRFLYIVHLRMGIEVEWHTQFVIRSIFTIEQNTMLTHEPCASRSDNIAVVAY